MKLPSFVLAAWCALLVSGWSAGATEAWLGVAPQVKLPPGLPVYTQELANFFGTAEVALRSDALRARVAKAEGAALAKEFGAVQLKAEHITGTSLVRISATGAEEAMCAKFAAAVAREFVAQQAEEKQAYYAAALKRVANALAEAANDGPVKVTLAEYQVQLRVAAALDTQSVWVVVPN